MQTIPSIRLEEIGGSTLRILETVAAERGDVSNMIKAMAQSPRTLEGYLRFTRALSDSRLEPKVREQIALMVAQENRCDYSLAQHAAAATRLGLTNDEIMESRDAHSNEKKASAALKFARGLLSRSSECSITDLRKAGYGDAEIVEVIGLIALNVFENYFNIVAQTDLDFPKIARTVKAA